MSFQVLTTSDGLKTLPRRGSVWVHKNGNVYIVSSITNTSDRQAEYPVTICYSGPDGREWSKPLTEWFEKMTPFPQSVMKLLEKESLSEGVREAIQVLLDKITHQEV